MEGTQLGARTAGFQAWPRYEFAAQPRSRRFALGASVSSFVKRKQFDGL